MEFNNQLIQIKRLDKQDVLIFQKLIQLFNKVFETENAEVTKETYLEKLLENPCFIAYAIIYKDEIIGGLTAYELAMYYSESSEVFIYDIAVKPGFQQNGLGKKLLFALKEYCSQNRIKEIFVAVNEEDKHALAFYRSTGGEEENVVHFNYALKKAQ